MRIFIRILARVAVYREQVRALDSGYLSIPFTGDVELTMKL